MKVTDYMMDVVVFDLDFTIWNGCKESIWAKSLGFPYKKSGDKIKGQNGLYIELQEGIYEITNALRENNIEMGFITRGGLKNIPYHSQPPVICLNMFYIYTMFNSCKIVMHKDEGTKSSKLNNYFNFSSDKNILFIDDNQLEVDDVSENCKHIRAINRNSFKSWKDLLWIEI